MMITRRAAARAGVDAEEAATGGSEDEGQTAPLTDKELRRRATELYAVAKEIGIDAVTCRSDLDHVGLPAHDNAQSAVRKAVDTSRKTYAEDDIAGKLFAAWMNDFINVRLDEASANRSAPEAPEPEKDTRDAKARRGASLYLDSLESGDPMTQADACEACGLDRHSKADCNFLGTRVRALEMERAAQNVDAAGGPASPALGANRVGRAGRKRKQPGADPAPAEKKILFGQKGVSKEEYDALMVAAATEVAERVKDDADGTMHALSKEMEQRLLDDHGLNVCWRTIFNRSKQPENTRSRHGGRYFAPEFERRIADLVKFIRAHKAPVFKD